MSATMGEPEGVDNVITAVAEGAAAVELRAPLRSVTVIADPTIEDGSG
jgi:hypothetical protein